MNGLDLNLAMTASRHSQLLSRHVVWLHITRYAFEYEYVLLFYRTRFLFHRRLGYI